MWIFIFCPLCGEKIEGCNTGDLVNSLRIHFEDECTEAEANR